MTPDLSYVIAPLAAWFASGTIKFAVNSAKARRWATDQIGYGGLPSTHTAIVCSTAMLVALREGISHPAFGVAVAIAFVVMLDAATLRREVGQHAQALNRLRDAASPGELRTRMGHSPVEILAGVATGALAGFLVDCASR